ncbi:hypothetical protein OCU04_008941 [Sclerotinia nivalis]|uniref:Uncharacterized protein n=1 Tax=Sclerotinia nivalis TaxID=352851 RepID=A0A9X0DH82_9HELO|nr:hypothetical protein OCU04_008941 [Sclerotinia nivalis]
MSTLASLDEYFKRFPSWPEDSLLHRIDKVGPGSSWNIRELGTFQVLRRAPNRGPPAWLDEYAREAAIRVEENEYLQSVLRLFDQDWRSFTHEVLTQSAGPLGSFVTLLSQVLETPILSDPQRDLRTRTDFQAPARSNAPNTTDSPSSELSSSPSEYPNKRIRKDRSPSSTPSSYAPSDESDQSTHDQRAKSETTTNACIYELLRCVTEVSRKETDPPCRMEWAMNHDTFTVQAASHTFTTTNDGSFVHKIKHAGRWQRASNYSYCSIEVSSIANLKSISILIGHGKTKSWYDIVEKSWGVKAQEAAHMIAMFCQHIPDGPLQHNIVIPLVSGAQNLFSLVLGNFPIEYQQYLRDGSQSQKLAFAEISEYGVFKLQDPEQLKVVFILIISLNLKLQSLGPIV